MRITFRRPATALGRTAPIPRYSQAPILCALALTALVLPATPAHAGDIVAQLADGQQLEQVDLKPGPTPTQVVLERDGLAPVTVLVEDLLAVDFGKVQGRPVIPRVRMINGDQVFGNLSFPTAKQVKVSAGWGTVTVPLAWCSAIRLKDNAPLPAPATKDTLVLDNDRVVGEVQGVSGEKVNFLLNGKSIPLDLSRIQAIALAPRAEAGEHRQGTVLNVDLGGGERLTGRWVKMDADVLSIALDWGQTVDVPIASISRLEVKNGKLVYVSDLKPSEVKEAAFLDGSFPFRADRTVAGRPMRLAGKSYRRGVGVHSRSDLTYTLDGKFQTFAATAGLDDEVGSQGSVVFRVYGDEKLLYESPLVHGGDAPLDLKVPLKGVLLLRLEVDYGDNGDAADHADWADARLLRE